MERDPEGITGKYLNLIRDPASLLPGVWDAVVGLIADISVMSTKKQRIRIGPWPAEKETTGGCFRAVPNDCLYSPRLKIGCFKFANF